MAANPFNTTIAQLTGSSTFYDWFTKENNEIIAKLNLATVSGVTGTDILASLNNTSGLVTLSLGGTAGIVASGVTFSGKVSFTGETAVPNTSFKYTGITSGTSGFTFGTVVRITSTGYTAAQANDADSAEVVGVLSALNTSYSVITLLGRINGDFTTVSGGTLSPGCVYFLDPSNAGKITTTEPTSVGHVSKPVIVGLGATAGMVVQYRGNYLNSSSGGESGTNRIYITFNTSPTDPRTKGFSGGRFLSYAPQILTGNTFFNQYLTDTGRTAIDGWFLSGSKSYAYSTYDFGSPYLNLPAEEDFIVGMVESISVSGSNLIYQILARGTSSVIPASISAAASAKGAWCLAGTTFNPLSTNVQLVQHPTSVQTNSSNYQVGFVFSNSPSSWYVNPRPLSNPNLSNYKSTDLPETLTNGMNYAYNGNFAIWQRDNGRISSYTSSGDLYFADNWIRRQANTGTSVQTLERKSFDVADTNVENNPKYYIDIKCLATPASAPSIASGRYSVGHVIDNIETFNGSSITVSFYAKCTSSTYKVANVYFARYSGGALVSKTTIGTVNLQTSWTKHILNYDVPSLSSSTYSNDYVEIGVDIIPLVKAAYDANEPTSTNVTVSLASLVVYNGTYTAPPHLFESDVEKLKKSQKYYYKTYTDSQVIGSGTGTALNCYTFTHLPNSPYGIFNFPSTMRSSPTVTIYTTSGNGFTNEVFNLSANTDARYTSGSQGYGGATRVANNSSSTASATSDASGVRVSVNSGSVAYDVLQCHIIADASYPI
jgi:hypothetical protein